MVTGPITAYHPGKQTIGWPLGHFFRFRPARPVQVAGNGMCKLHECGYGSQCETPAGFPWNKI